MSITEHISGRTLFIMDASVLIAIYGFSFVILRSPVEVYLSYIPMFILLPFFILRYGIPQVLFLIFIPLLLFGGISIYFGDNTTFQLLKIFLGLFSSLLFFNHVFQFYRHDLNYLIKLYLKSALIIGLIGLMQIIAFRLGITPLYRFSWILNKWGLSDGGFGIRVNSIFSEPAYYATTLAPAFFIASYNLICKIPIYITKRQSFIIVICYFLSFSSMGILAIFLTVFLILIRFGFLRVAVLFLPLAIGGYLFAYIQIPEFRERLDGTVETFSNPEFDRFDVHGSSFVLYNNYQVTISNFSDHPLFGSGLGSHPTAFDKYSLTNSMPDVGLDLNSQDANSLFLRTLSEAGIFGVFVLLYFIIKNIQRFKNSHSEENWAFSAGVLILIILYLVRQGHYFYCGFPFFLWMFYYLKKASKNPKAFGLSVKE